MEKDTGGSSEVIPTWDGQAGTYSRFAKDLSWWEAGEDWSRVGNINVGARFVKQQKGVVKSRCEEFSP